MKALSVLLLTTTACAIVQAQLPIQGVPGPGSVQPTRGQDAATLTIQFDNRKSTVTDSRRTQQVISALAQHVFAVPPQQVAAVGGVDQSRMGGLLRTRSVVTFRAVGPTSNGRTVLANCQANTRSGMFSSSTAERAVRTATDTWWPGDSVRVQRATCAQG